MIQPHLPVRLPCYDLAPVTEFAFDGIATGFGHPRLPWLDGRCVQGPGTYSPQHDDLRLLAIPTSCSRVADYNPNCGRLWGFPLPRGVARCTGHCITCVAPDIRAMMTWRHPHLPHYLRRQSPQRALLLKQLRIGVALVAGLNPTSHDTSWRQPCSTSVSWWLNTSSMFPLLTSYTSSPGKVLRVASN